MSKFLLDEITPVTVSPNAETQKSTVTRPTSTSRIYSTFKEVVSGSGLVRTIFDALPKVKRKDSHSTAFQKWPDSYGTNQRPWGRPADPATGYREERLEGENWDQMIAAIAKSRVAGLSDQADLAMAIATGIDEALGSVFRSGVTIVQPEDDQSITIGDLDFNINATNIPQVTWRRAGDELNYPRITSIGIDGGNSFTVYFSAAVTASTVLDWRTIARKLT